MKLLPELSIEDFKECIDNAPVLFIVCLSILWSVFAVLYNLAIYNTMEIFVIFLFLIMIISSIAVFNYAGIKTDFREHKDILVYIFGVTLSVSMIIIFGTIIGIAVGQNIVCWNPHMSTFEVTELNPTYEHVYIRFQAFSEFLRVDTTLIYDILTNILLVAPAEELVFRGVLPYLFTKVLKSPWTGGITSTAIWATLHTIVSYTGPDAWTYVLMCFVGGLCLFYMMIQTKDITVPILGHALYNSIVRIMVGA